MFPVATARPWKFRWVATTYGLLTKHKVKMAGYSLSYVFWVFMDQDGVKVHQHAENKEWDKYSAMTGRAWLIKDLLWKRTLFLWDQAGNSKQAAVPSVPQDCGKWALGTSLELLFQGGFLQVPLICTPPRRGPPSCFPQSLGLWIGASCLEAG